MSRTVDYLTERVDFLQISEDVPVTKKRKPEKVDPPEVFEGSLGASLAFVLVCSYVASSPTTQQTRESLYQT
jgi:hypothetical protein